MTRIIITPNGQIAIGMGINTQFVARLGEAEKLVDTGFERGYRNVFVTDATGKERFVGRLTTRLLDGPLASAAIRLILESEGIQT